MLNGVIAYALSMSQYVQESVKNVEKEINKRGLVLAKCVKLPFTTNYCPELDGSKDSSVEDAVYYQSLIGVLQWIVEMGRMDINMEVSAMSSFVAAPRYGHFLQLLQIFAYLICHHAVKLVFDPSYPEIDDTQFERKDWSGFYGSEKEPVPANSPKPKWKEFIITAYVDVSFAGYKLTRRSRTGFIVYLNSTPIHWYSKKQGSYEISIFGSESVAMRQCCEYVRELRYKLRMMEIPVNNPAFIFGDNQSVVWNTTVLESSLKKKSCAVAYYFCREDVSRLEWLTAYIRTHLNSSDIMTKSVSSIKDRIRKVRMLLYDIYIQKLMMKDNKKNIIKMNFAVQRYY